MDEQEEKNQASSFEKQSHDKALNKLNDLQRKNKKVNKIVTLIKTKKIIIPLLIILGVVVFFVMWGNFVSLFYNLSIGSTNSAKKAAISTSYSTDSTSPETGNPNETQNGNTSVNSSRVVVKPTKNKDGYEITNNYTSEEIKKLREELEKDTSRDISDFSDFEIAIIGALAENGLDIDDWNISELKCFPAFIKAEACTQYLDLRPNSDKFKGGKYVPEKVDKDGSKVPGVILVQRTNTNGNEVNTLEYMKESEFNKLVDANDEKAINYFTVNDKGNLVIAKWDMEEITVTGEYPENLSESEKEKSTGEVYTITTEEIAYSQYITKYTMPFELLVQLLSMLEDPDFCMELVDYVMGSKIVINIQEEETYTHTVEKRTYTVHSKDEKRIDYQIASVVAIEANEDYPLENSKDDKGEACTNYEVNDKKVTVDRKYTSHSYVFEIIEADTWIAHYTKSYAAPTTKNEPTVTNVVTDIPDKYTEINTDNKSITDINETIKDKDVKEFKDEKEKYYKDLITIPEVKLKANRKIEIGDGELGPQVESYEIDITPKGKIKSTSLPGTYKKYESNENGNFGLPSQINVDTTSIQELPSIRFTYYLNNGKYTTSDTKEQIAQCNVTKLDIKEYERIDTVNNITTDVTRYESDPNPIKRVDLYDKVDEKFLQAYDKSERAQHMMRSIASWLFEVMEEDERTVEFIDIIKYLLYKYDGTDYGVTELDLSLFEADEFATYSTNNSFDAIKNFIHYFEGTPKYNSSKTKYVVFDDGVGNPTVGWGIAIKAGGYTNVFKAAGYSTEIGAEVDIDFVDALEDEELNECIEYIRSKTDNLTDYQLGALVSRCYQMGKSGAMFTNKHNYETSVSYDFATSYKKYWKSEDTENYYKKAITEAIYNHDLYKNYMKVSTYASGKQLAGLVKRRQWEWQLFATGYDATTNTYWSSSGGSIDNINLYNADGTVNKTAISNLNADLTRRVNNKSDKEMNSPYNTLQYKQCTWWAYTRASQYLEQYGTKYKKYPRKKDGTSGHGGTWYDVNKQNNWFEYGSEPKANSIISWKHGQYGHVAYVEAVDYKNKKMYISHAGSGVRWYGVQEIPINGEVWGGWASSLNGYIYLDSPK